MPRHMLVVGLSRQVHRRARSLGLRLSAVMPTSQVKRADPRLYERIVGLPDSSSTEEWVAAGRFVHTHAPIDAIGGFNEVTQHHAAAIAAELGLFFHSAEVILRTRRKDEMRAVLRAAGLDATPSSLVDDAAGIRMFAASHGYPVVLKPVDGRGSLAVAILPGPDAIGPAVARFHAQAADTRMLVEGLLVGDEYSVEAFSERGEHRVIAITQKFKDPVTCVETGHCLPAPLPDADRAAVATFVAQALTALGLVDGPSHTEVFLTAAGPRIVETHARWGGDNIVDLLQLVAGVDADGLWARHLAGERVLEEVPTAASGWASVAFVSPRAEGKLLSIEGEAAAAAMPGVHAVELLQSAGAMVSGPQDSSGRGAAVVAVGGSAAEAVERARAGAAALRFVVSCPT